jgi:TolA-binding protein
MLTARKKFTRKELHKDPLLAKIAMATDYAKLNRDKMSKALTGVIVAIAAVWGYMYYKSSIDEDSLNRLYQAEQAYLSGDNKEAIRRLAKYLAEFEGTKGGELATFYLANAYYQTDQFDFALEQYENYVDDYGSNDLLTASAMAGIAACYEAQNKYADAAVQYEAVAGKFPEHYQRTEYMMGAARCYKMLGNVESAKSWYERVVKEYPETTYAREARLAIDEFGA